MKSDYLSHNYKVNNLPIKHANIQMVFSAYQKRKLKKTNSENYSSHEKKDTDETIKKGNYEKLGHFLS